MKHWHMHDYFEALSVPVTLNAGRLRKGRSVRDGYHRGWGLDYGGLREAILDDPLYKEAYALAEGRTIQAEACRMNLFLLVKYFLPRMLAGGAGGTLIEFGSFRGGSAIFLAALCRALGLNARVFGLDTVGGMPPTDKEVDAHNAGDFSGVDLDQLRRYVAGCGLEKYLEFVPGVFEETAPGLLAGAAPVLLAHIDCDVYPSVAFAWDVVRPAMAPGGYVVFDDAHTSSCLGATEVVEDLVIRRDGLNCEQIWPHFVFRIWPEPEPSGQDVAAQADADPQQLRTLPLKLAALRHELQLARSRITEKQTAVDELQDRLQQAQAVLADLQARHRVLSDQVRMAQSSRWLWLGQRLGLGPKFV
jgi:predicted O-methyltransferase YrrM